MTWGQHKGIASWSAPTGIVVAAAASGNAAELQYVSVTGGTKYDPLTAENATPLFSGTNSRIMTLDIDEATGLVSDPVGGMLGYTLALTDIFGDSYTYSKGDIVEASILTNQVSEANIAPCLILHAGGINGPTDAADGIGCSIQHNAGDWQVSTWRCTGAGYSQRLATTDTSTTRGAMVAAIPRAGSGTSLTASPLDANGEPIATTNTGTIDDVWAGSSLTHVTVGALITGAYTDTIQITAALWLKSSFPAIDPFP